jgi:hypothetical protein
MEPRDFYQVISLTQLPSRVNGGFYFKAMLQNIHTRDTYETNIDPTMRNFPNWGVVISNAHRGIILSGCRLKQLKNKIIVDADSPIHLEVVCDPEELNDVLAEWRSDRQG